MKRRKKGERQREMKGKDKAEVLTGCSLVCTKFEFQILESPLHNHNNLKTRVASHFLLYARYFILFLHQSLIKSYEIGRGNLMDVEVKLREVKPGLTCSPPLSPPFASSPSVSLLTCRTLGPERR